MALMSRDTGLNIDDMEHLVQSVVDIVTTPIGTRVCLREYGCLLPYRIDLPINRAWVSEAYGEIAEALDRWEPRLSTETIFLDASAISLGKIGMGLDGIYRPLGKVISLRNITLDFSRG